MQQHEDETTISEEKEMVRELAGLGADTEITFSDFGWTSRVYIVGCGEIVFKFPGREEVKQEYELEVAAYEIARDIASDVLIPQTRWVHPTYNYLGYRGVVGTSMEEIFRSLSANEKRDIGARIGTFLKRFHRRNISNAPLMSPEREFAEYKRKMELGLPVIEKHFSESEIARIRHLILEDYPQKVLELGFKKGLCHADLGFWNMIYTPTGGIGLIDFGDVGYYDVSIDFAGMNDSHMLEGALKAYGGEVPEEKIALRRKTIPVLDLPYFIRKGDDSGVQETISRIRRITLA